MLGKPSNVDNMRNGVCVMDFVVKKTFEFSSVQRPGYYPSFPPYTRISSTLSLSHTLALVLHITLVLDLNIYFIHILVSYHVFHTS
jgi:hypothetical protein